MSQLYACARCERQHTVTTGPSQRPYPPSGWAVVTVAEVGAPERSYTFCRGCLKNITAVMRG